MRTQLLSPAGALILLAASGLSGCDNIDAGTLGEDAAPPKLMKVLVQDWHPFNGRGIVTDVINTRAPKECSEKNPCVSGQFGYPSLIGQYTALSSDCLIEEGKTTGVCADPLAAGPVQIGLPAVAGFYKDEKDMKNKSIVLAGIQIRLVFHKLIDPKLEEVTVDPQTGVYHYKLADGLVKLLDWKNEEVPLAFGGQAGSPANPRPFGVPPGVFWDPTGSLETADPVVLPIGPAIVIRPEAPLVPGKEYTIVIKGSAIKDRKGKAATDAAGAPLSDEHKIPFKTEGLFVMSSTQCPLYNCTNAIGTFNYPDDESEKPAIAPNEILQVQTNADIDDGTSGLDDEGYPEDRKNPKHTVLTKVTVVRHAKVCEGGTKKGTECAADGDCPGSACKDADLPTAVESFSDRGTLVDVCSSGDYEGAACGGDDDCCEEGKMCDAKCDAIGVPDWLDCEGARNYRSLNIAPVDKDGKRSQWKPGKYTLTVAGFKDNDSKSTEVTEHTIEFTVGEEVAKPEESPFAMSTFDEKTGFYDDYGPVLRSECHIPPKEEPPAPDMAMPSKDMAMPSKDMAMPKSDGGVPDLATKG